MMNWLNWWNWWIVPRSGTWGKWSFAKRSDPPIQPSPEGAIPQAPKGRSPNSFTLIELLVVISVMAILFGMGIVAYNEFNRRQILNQAAKTLKNDLRLAQSKALSGEKPSGCTTTLLGYRVNFSSIGDGYTIVAVCDSSEIEPRSYALPVNVSFPSPPPSSSSPLFRVLAQSVQNPATITLRAFGREQTVTITASGEIY